MMDIDNATLLRKLEEIREILMDPDETSAMVLDLVDELIDEIGK